MPRGGDAAVEGECLGVLTTLGNTHTLAENECVLSFTPRLPGHPRAINEQVEFS